MLTAQTHTLVEISASLSQSHTIMIAGLLLTPAATAFVAYRPPSGLLRSLLPACYTIFVLLAAFLGILTVLAFENRFARFSLSHTHSRPFLSPPLTPTNRDA